MLHIIHTTCRPALVRMTDGLICCPQACTFGGRKSFSDLQHLSHLRYLAWWTGIVLNLSWFRSTVSLPSINCSKKETAVFQALKLRDMTGVMLPNKRTLIAMATMRSSPMFVSQWSPALAGLRRYRDASLVSSELNVNKIRDFFTYRHEDLLTPMRLTTFIKLFFKLHIFTGKFYNSI